MRSTVRFQVIALLLVMLASTTASQAALVGQPVLMTFTLNGVLFPLANPTVSVTDPGIEYDFGNGIVNWQIDLSDAGMTISQAPVLIPVIANDWHLQLFTNSAGIDWLDRLTVMNQGFNPALTWARASPNSLIVSWAGGQLPRGGFTTQFSAVPVPTALWLFGSGLTGLLGLAWRR